MLDDRLSSSFVFWQWYNMLLGIFSKYRKMCINLELIHDSQIIRAADFPAHHNTRAVEYVIEGFRCGRLVV
jgi:hypothetical protein